MQEDGTVQSPMRAACALFDDPRPAWLSLLQCMDAADGEGSRAFVGEFLVSGEAWDITKLMD